MTEKIQRLAMRAFRGVPGEMIVDFGKGESIAVYGDNGTGKSTIADALEWYFTGEIELLCHEGRQHAVRHVGGERDDATSVEVVTNGALGGTVVFPDERAPEAFQAIRRETFLLRGRTLADFINKTKTEKWKALVEILGLDAIESLREDLQRARNDLRKEAKAADEQVQACRRALASATARPSRTRPSSPASSRSARCWASMPPQSLDRWSTRRGSRRRLARARPAAEPSGARNAARRAPVAGHAGVRHAARSQALERARLLGTGAAPAARLAGPRSQAAGRRRIDRRTLSAVRPESRREEAGAQASSARSSR